MPIQSTATAGPVTDISMPVAKAASGLAVAAAAKADVADQVALQAAAGSSWQTWEIVNSIPWGNIASIVAVLYTMLLITEWFWKKLWRPLFERRGWIKAKKRRVYTAREISEMLAAQDTDHAQLP